MFIFIHIFDIAAPSSSDFDLTLMICLLKNFTEMDKSDIFPMETDTSDAACLLRLKHYRNNIVHSKTFALSDEDFKQYWEHITCVSDQQIDYKKKN